MIRKLESVRVSLLSSVLTVFGVWVDWPLSIVVAGRALDLQGRGMDTQVSDLVDRVVQGEGVELLILKSCPVIISNANKANLCCQDQSQPQQQLD